MPEGCSVTGMVADRPGIPSSLVTATCAACTRPDRVNAVCTSRAAAAASAYDPGGQSRAIRASSLASCAAVKT